MVDEIHAARKRIRTLSDSSRSISSSNSSSDSSRESTAASSSPLPQARSRKQNIRELREEFDDFPELYGIRRSVRSRKPPSRFKPLQRKAVHKRIGSSDLESDQLTESDDDWSESLDSKHRTVRTRGHRVNYTSAFIDESLGDSDNQTLENSISRQSTYRSLSTNQQSNQQTSLQKPKGSLIRKPYTDSSDVRSSKSVKPSNNYLEDLEVDERASDDSCNAVVHNSDWVGDEEVDVIDEVLTHAVRRKNAIGNPTTLYNTLLERDLNAGFDPNVEEGELQFLIKWRNWSHIHSTWETENSLLSPDRGTVAGMKKFYTYQTQLNECKERLRFAERDDLETLAYEEERAEQVLHDKMTAERIVSHSRDPNANIYDYLVKWHRLDYRFCTWESGKVINSLFRPAVLAYEKRRVSTKIPNYRSELFTTRPKFVALTEQPDYLGDQTDYRLRDYQLEGINWIIRAWTRGNSVILADEMGLGKTIQTIGFLSVLFHKYELFGPFLIVVPLSTVSSWQKELESWAPELNTIIYTGDHVSRQLLREHEWALGGIVGARRQQSLKFNICVTTYEILLKDKSWLGQVHWAFLGVDEAHRLKNDSSQLYKTLFTFHTNTRLLITGTPLQNTMKELWALLHFVMPDHFENWDLFEETHSVAADDSAMNSESFHNLHKVLKPFLLRRVKKDVESSLPEKIEQILRVDMTKEQANIYRLILARNYDGLMKVTRGHKASFVNIVMELKKCCNHAHLIAPPNYNDRNYMTKEERLRPFLLGSGKAALLDKLLQRLRSKGHRVLIFSQMVRMLDLIADYLGDRGWGFQRLDGSIRGELRKQALDHFNADGSTDFCFLLSTRAGGLGINLATADTVIIFDSDWNPQNDLQAQARAHRIGQTKQVSVYRFVTRESVEEKIIESATRKMVLDHLVIQRMDSTGSRGRRGDISKGHFLTEILRYGAENLFTKEEETAELEVDIDDILNRAETRDTDASVQCNPANALLSSFKVVNLDPQDDELNKKDEPSSFNKSWDDIIPLELRGKLKAEEAQKTLVGLELGPRRRRQVKTFQAGIDTHPSSEDGSDDEYEKTSTTPLSEKEIRALVRAIRHFARPLERIDAIAADAELPDYSESELREVIDAVVKGCKAALLSSQANPVDDVSKSNVGSKGPIFQYGRVSVAARPLIQSLECLEILYQSLPGESKDARMMYELPFIPKLVAWSCPWDISDDVRLLTGVYEHGYDNWEAIKMDADLGLGSKLLPFLQTERPQANHLRSRVDYLLKMLAKHNTRSSESLSKTKKQVDESGRHATKVRNRVSTHKGAVKSNAPGTLSNPKSAEFVETDDSSSDSEHEATKSTPQKKKPKRSAKSKLKDVKSKNQDALVKSSMSATGTSAVFTKEEKKNFLNMRGSLFLRCKELLQPIKKHFKQLEHLEDVKDDDVKQFSKVMLRIGDHIYTVVHDFDKKERHAWKIYLWEFVNIFSKKSSEELRHIYRRAVKRRSKDTKEVEKVVSNHPPKHRRMDDVYREPSNQHSGYRGGNDESVNKRRYSYHGRQNEPSNMYGLHKFGGRSTTDWSSTVGGREFNRDRDNLRFNNAFNRPPGYNNNNSDSMSKQYRYNRNFGPTVCYQNHFSSASTTYFDARSSELANNVSSNGNQNIGLGPNPKTFYPPTTQISYLPEHSSSISLSRDPRLSAVRR